MIKNKRFKKRKMLFTGTFVLLSALGYVGDWTAKREEVDGEVIQTTDKQIYQVREYHKIFEKVGERLLPEGLSISPSTFADYALIVSYCESGWNPQAKNSIDAQGLFQWTRATRFYLDIPSNITDKAFEDQAEYLYLFIKATGKANKIKTAADLHQINLSPSTPMNTDTLCNIENNAALDFDENGYINKNDLILFQKKRILSSKNPTLMGIWSKYLTKP